VTAPASDAAPARPSGTFGGAPARDLAADWRAEAGVLGVPTDRAVGFRKGARDGPRALRAASRRYLLPPEGFFDLARGRAVLAGFDIADVGDVAEVGDVAPSGDAGPDGPEGAAERARITAAARALRARVRWPTFLGGDHGISFPLLLAFDDVADLHVVQFDAHLDFSDRRGEDRHSNSSPFRRAAEALPNLAHVTTIGLRGLRTDPEAYAAALARGHTLVSASAVEADLAGVVARLPEGQRVYVSLDVDALDPALLPGTGSPEVDGLRYRDLAALLAAVAERNEVVGADVVELAPALDPSGLSALVAARAVFDLWAAVRG
jgi:agmatinase